MGGGWSVESNHRDDIPGGGSMLHHTYANFSTQDLLIQYPLTNSTSTFLTKNMYFLAATVNDYILNFISITWDQILRYTRVIQKIRRLLL